MERHLNINERRKRRAGYQDKGERFPWKQAWGILSENDRAGFRWVLLLGIISAGAAAAMIAALASFLSVIADPSRIQSSSHIAWISAVIGTRSTTHMATVLGGITIAIIIFASAFQIYSTFARHRFAAACESSISTRLFTGYLIQPYSFFVERNSSLLSANVIGETNESIRSFFKPTIDLVTSLLTTGAITLVIFWINPTVTLVTALVLALAYLLIYILVRRKIRAAGRTRALANGKRYKLASDGLQSAKDVKILGIEERLSARFSAQSQEVANSTAHARTLEEVPRFVVLGGVFSALVIICILLAVSDQSGKRLQENAALIGVFALAGQRLLPEVQSIFRTISSLQFGAAAVSRLHVEFTGLKQVDALPKLEALPLLREINFNEVTYVHPGATSPSLKSVSLSIPRGIRVGVTGPSGAGKSTFADLLLGLLTPQSGTLTVDDIDITPENTRAWQKNVAYVPQEIFLIDDTIAANVAFGQLLDDMDDDLARQSLKFAGLLDFVDQELPDGIATVIGERGVRLSGGQRQRVGIARALYRDARLIVLDEATSALDNQTERDVIEAIKGLPAELTVIIIAHRLSTLDDCDRLLVLSDGAVEAYGSHIDVVSNSPTYRRLRGQ